MSGLGTTKQLKVGDFVKATTMWADAEFPNVRGTVVALRHGGAVAVIETEVGRSPRTLHTSYLQ